MLVSVLAAAAVQLGAASTQYQVGLIGCHPEAAHPQIPVGGWSSPSATDARLMQQAGAVHSPAPWCLSVDVMVLPALGPNVTLGADIVLAPCIATTPVPAAAAAAAHDAQGWSMLQGGWCLGCMDQKCKKRVAFCSYTFHNLIMKPIIIRWPDPVAFRPSALHRHRARPRALRRARRRAVVPAIGSCGRA